MKQRTRILWKVRSFITKSLAKYLLNTLINPLFRHCDFIYDGCSTEISRWLQVAQNSALRAIKNCKIKYPTAKLRDNLEIDFLSDAHKKSTVKMVYRRFHNEGPMELNNMFEIYKPNRQLRSEMQNLLLPQRMRTKLIEQNIVVRGCIYWNDLNQQTRQISSLERFNIHLKGYNTF